MMDNTLWAEWLKNWNWILAIAKRRNWDVKELVIKPTVSISEIEEIERELGILYPTEFKTILTKYSSSVMLNWQIEHEETEGEFRQVFCGGGWGQLWDFEILRENYDGYMGWVTECFPNPEDEYDRIWHNKVPILRVPNGDMIVLDTFEKKENCPVIYLSHDGSDFHGHRLGENFIDFISRWSNIGCVGTEDWQYEPFYDYENMTLKDSGEVIARWKKWLEQGSS
jgi:hypothetical protein